MQFEEGQKYRNRGFEYEVLNASKEKLMVRTSEGAICELSVEIQSRILENLDREAREQHWSLFDPARGLGAGYENHCWRCSAHISSADLCRCRRCHWYVCRSCEACGCGYRLRWAFARVDFAA